MAMDLSMKMKRSGLADGPERAPPKEPEDGNADHLTALQRIRDQLQKANGMVATSEKLRADYVTAPEMMVGLGYPSDFSSGSSTHALPFCPSRHTEFRIEDILKEGKTGHVEGATLSSHAKLAPPEPSYFPPNVEVTRHVEQLTFDPADVRGADRVRYVSHPKHEYRLRAACPADCCVHAAPPGVKMGVSPSHRHPDIQVRTGRWHSQPYAVYPEQQSYDGSVVIYPTTSAPLNELVFRDSVHRESVLLHAEGLQCVLHQDTVRHPGLSYGADDVGARPHAGHVISGHLRPRPPSDAFPHGHAPDGVAMPSDVQSGAPSGQQRPLVNAPVPGVISNSVMVRRDHVRCQSFVDPVHSNRYQDPRVRQAPECYQIQTKEALTPDGEAFNQMMLWTDRGRHDDVTEGTVISESVYREKCTEKRLSGSPLPDSRCIKTRPYEVSWTEPSSEYKRPRTSFTDYQLLRLRAEFQANCYLSEERRLALAKELGLGENQVKIWFQNNRAKLKKASYKKETVSNMDPYYRA